MAKEKSLVIVESPTKAKTIGKILGSDFSVVASMGHLIDLPRSKLGVDIEDGFKPQYIVIVKRRKMLTALKKEAKDKNKIYVATDPDREGEAIGWHIKERIFQDKKVLRVIFHEITPAAVKDAFIKARDFDLNLIEAQAGRRILDRVVGYSLSPLLWKKIARGLSAGRVQSVALKLIIEREKQISAFIPQEYWEIESGLAKKGSTDSFSAKLEKVEGQKAQIKNKEEADRLIQEISNQQFAVSDIEKKEKKRYPDAPFITSTLQQEAFNKLKFNAGKTMLIAQQLYEGIDIGTDSPVGLITYMRTDSVHIASEAINEARSLILKKFGKDYLPEKPNVYKVKKFAQEAHEAIRPSLISKEPESLKEFLTPEQHKLYEIIYRRFIASQMPEARYLATRVEIEAGKYLFSVSGTELIFDGFSAVYDKQETHGLKGEAGAPLSAAEEQKKEIPLLEKGELLELVNLMSSQHFTKPPPRFSDSSLVKVLEEEGIGRPSTYAPIVYTLILRNYIHRIKGYFHPTELGFKVCDLLVEYFPKIMDTKFTAFLEEELDEIAEGKLDKLKVLQDFYAPFKESLDFAQANIKKEVIQTSEVCDKCGKPMVIKWGKRGKFLSCAGYPECKNSKSITTGVKCPQADCGGELIERYSTRGPFFGCSNYPNCKFASWRKPG